MVYANSCTKGNQFTLYPMWKKTVLKGGIITLIQGGMANSEGSYLLYKNPSGQGLIIHPPSFPYSFFLSAT